MNSEDEKKTQTSYTLGGCVNWCTLKTMKHCHLQDAMDGPRKYCA